MVYLGLLLLAQGLFAQSLLPRDSLVADFRQFIQYFEETHPDPYILLSEEKCSSTGKPLKRKRNYRNRIAT